MREFHKEKLDLYFKEGKNVAEIKYLNLRSSGNSLIESLENLKKDYNSLINFAKEKNFELPNQINIKNKSNLITRIKDKLIDFSINILFLIISLMFIFFLFKGQLEYYFNENISSGSNFFEQLIKEINNAADPKNDIDKDIEEQVINDLGKIVTRIQPFMSTIDFCLEKENYDICKEGLSNK